jgi:hypothetical protein
VEAAKRTLEVTTQRGVRMVLHRSQSRRFRTNDWQLRYKRRRADVFGDTLIADTISKQKNKYAEVFATSVGGSRVFSVKVKSDAHEAVSLLFKQDGVSTAMIVDAKCVVRQIVGSSRLNHTASGRMQLKEQFGNSSATPEER